jgi:hypothetical protein
MKKKLIKELHKILMEIVKADDETLDAIGIRLLEIEKDLMKYEDKEIREDKLIAKL